MQNEFQDDIVYFAPDLAPWILDNAPGNDGLLFEKEVIYSFDQFVRDDGETPRVEFGIDGSVLKHFHDTTQLMLANGVEIPIPLGHTNEPTATQGQVVGSRIGKNARNEDALFLKTQFKDARAAEIAKNADVSVYVPHKFIDGKGRTYVRPIRHLAITAYPTIPGLGKYQAIAASFTPGQPQAAPKAVVAQHTPVAAHVPPAAPQTPPNGAPPQMSASTLLPLAQQLGVPNAETLDDASITTAIVGVFQLMKDKIDELESGGAEGSENEPQPNIGQQPPTNGPPNMTTQPQNLGPAKKKLPPAFAASFGKMLKDNRTAKLDALVLGGHILPPVRDALVAEYCGEPALALSLDAIAADENATEVSDVTFDKLCEALKKNKTLNAGEKSGAQLSGALALSNPSASGEANPLIANAERRAKEAREMSPSRN
jgi:hypothetical protein